MNPESLRFTRTHEWVAVEKTPSGEIATVGISDFAVQALTDLVFLQLPTIGAKVEAGQPFGEVESVKAVNDLYSPVTGTVVEANSPLVNDLEQISRDPFGAGWLIKVKLDSPLPSDLLDHDAYRQQCAADEH